MGRALRHVGQMYGLIELLEKVGTKAGTHHTIWKCKCNGCGKIYNKISTDLRPKTTYSCGCQKKVQNNASPNWKGVGEISATHFSRIKSRAQKSSIKFDVDIDFLWELFLKQNRRCALSGLEIFFGRSGRDINTASLDRIESSLPYEKTNVQWVHKHINAMKLNHPQQYFISLCKIISKNNEK